MIKDCDIIIVGGGLSGLTSAIHLLQAGHTVMLIEKNEYPKHKVCGEYVSNEVLLYLWSLGVDPISNGAKEINTFQFSGRSGEALDIDLPLGGFGISRYAFDLILFEKAIMDGLIFENGVVKNISFQTDIFEVSLPNKTFKAPYVIGAYGKRSGLDIMLSRKFMSKKSPWLGVKAHYKGDFPDNLVALHNFNGGYCGLSKVETNAVNVCYLANFKSFKKYKDVDRYRTEVLEQNYHLKDFFKTAEPLFEKPLTISQISFQRKSAVENHILMVGDSAGLIHPLCGNGMAMAIHSAKIVCDCIVYHLKTNNSRSALEEAYSSAWRSNFSGRMRMGSLIQRGLQSSSMTKFGVRILQDSPHLLKRVIRSTHGKPIAL